MTFSSSDGRAVLRVFPTMPLSLRVMVRPFYDLLALPPLSGRLAGLLVYEVVAEPCGGGQPLAEFPSEVNFSVNYLNEDVYDVNEQAIRFVWLEPETMAWIDVEKQALDTARNAIGATVTRTGLYAVYQDP